MSNSKTNHSNPAEPTTPDTFSEDWDGAEDTIDFPENAGEILLPVGTYLAEVESVKVAIGTKVDADGRSHKYYNIQFNILDEEYKGRKIWTNISFSPKALIISFRNLSTIAGHPIERTNYQITPMAETYVGRVVRIKVRHGEWDGEQRAEVDRILPPPMSYLGVSEQAPVGPQRNTLF